MKLNEVYEKINNLLKNDKKVIIAIDGLSCSGKTYLANLIAKKYKAQIVHMDDFYLPLNSSKDLPISFDGNINFKRLNDEVISQLKNNEFMYNVFSCKEQKIITSKKVKLTNLTIFEGSYSLHPKLGRYYDLSIYLSINDKLQNQRIKDRNPNNFDSFLNTWFPLEKAYDEHYSIKSSADLVIDASSLL